jgi:uncharacterized protein YjbI with pentapeptide repeats
LDKNKTPKTEFEEPSLNTCLDYIKSGFSKWNEFKLEHPEWIPNLDGADFDTIDLFNVDLSNCSLVKADLSQTINLHEKNLGGSNLDGAKLPKDFGFNGLKTVEEISVCSSKNFMSIMLLCFYCWLTICSTNNLYLLTNSSNSTLPILNVPLDIIGFYIAAPIILLAFYTYFHLNLKKLWSEFSELPAYFPDGKSIEQKTFSWLINDFSINYIKLVKKENLLFFRLKNLLVIILAWGVVPITIFGIWAKYLINHEMVLSSAHSIALVLCLTIGFLFFQNACRTLQVHPKTKENNPLCFECFILCNLKFISIFISLILILILASYVNANSSFGYSYNLNNVEIVKKPDTWVALEKQVYDLVPKDTNFEQKIDDILALIKPLNLQNRNLRNLKAERAFLVNVNLTNANLQDTMLAGAYLQNANLTGANFQNAVLIGVNFKGAILWMAKLQNADLIGANLQRADLSDSILINADLSGAALQSAYMKGANLYGANLTNAGLEGADLSQTLGLTYNQLKAAIINENTKLPQDLLQYRKKLLELSNIKLTNWAKSFKIRSY